MKTTTRSDEVVAKHKKYLWPSVTNYFEQPLVADRGEMQHLWDVEGNKYLDFFGGIARHAIKRCQIFYTGIAHSAYRAEVFHQSLLALRSDTGYFI